MEEVDEIDRDLRKPKVKRRTTSDKTGDEVVRTKTISRTKNGEVRRKKKAVSNNNQDKPRRVKKVVKVKRDTEAEEKDNRDESCVDIPKKEAPIGRRKSQKSKPCREEQDSENSEDKETDCVQASKNDSKRKAKAGKKLVKKKSSKRQVSSDEEDHVEQESKSKSDNESGSITSKSRNSLAKKKATKNDASDKPERRVPSDRTYEPVEEIEHRTVLLHGYVKKLKRDGSLFASLYNRRYFAVEFIIGTNVCGKPSKYVRLTYYGDKYDFDLGLNSRELDIKNVVALTAFQDAHPKLRIDFKDESDMVLLRFKRVREWNYWASGMESLTGLELECEEKLKWPVGAGQQPLNIDEY